MIKINNTDETNNFCGGVCIIGIGGDVRDCGYLPDTLSLAGIWVCKNNKTMCIASSHEDQTFKQNAKCVSCNRTSAGAYSCKSPNGLCGKLISNANGDGHWGCVYVPPPTPAPPTPAPPTPAPPTPTPPTPVPT